MCGTLCYFDNSAVSIADEEFEFLQHLAQLFPYCIKQASKPVQSS